MKEDRSLVSVMTAALGGGVPSCSTESVIPHLYSAALFWADKIVTLTKDNAQDVYWLAQCMYLLRQYHRAAHVIKSRGLEKTHLLCHYLTVRCLLEARELSEALQVLITAEQEGTFLYSSGIDDLNTDTPDSNFNHLRSAVSYLKGCVYEAMDNRGLAADCYKQALRYDVHCYEAFEALVQHQMLTAWEERELMDSLPFSEQCSAQEEMVMRLLYESKLKKYQAPGMLLDVPSIQLEDLAGNLDLVVAKAEQHYYNCNYRECIHITEEVLKKDPYHSSCLPVHIGCLVELKRSNQLFYLAHRLVDLYPEMAISWFAVGCYYYVIGKSDPARRYLSKATTLDRLFGPAWLAYGHSFAVENEHDQAMAAYFKASQLMKGCHLPLLYIGLECGLTNNVKLADKFFIQAQSIAPEDPFVIHEMGVIAFQNQDYHAAERHFQEALTRVRSINELALAEKWEALLNNLGHTCRKLRKYSEALEYHQQALVLSPLNPSTYSAMGFVHALMGNTSEAVEAFHKALGIRRDDTFSTTMLGYVIEQLMEDTPPFKDAPDEPPSFGFSASLPPMVLNLDKSSLSTSLFDSDSRTGVNLESDSVQAEPSSSSALIVEVEMQDSSSLQLD
ncbi:cell division cycle protein 16 homolog isoform X2 [Anabrus simplex]|uniref:cell division cycle protein 16 homolog isoform X2 n=1 Tax=Anabrus simplex TaxID=316456 RepID=UPI0035A36291